MMSNTNSKITLYIRDMYISYVHLNTSDIGLRLTETLSVIYYITCL